jgi:hypothetical protein
VRERALIRHEMGQHFGQYPRLADGIMLRTWRTGERKGQPKIPPAIDSMMARGLVAIRHESRCRGVGETDPSAPGDAVRRIHAT